MIAQGFKSARRVTQRNGRSFYFASFALDPERRAAAFAIYAFFRRLDDAFDVHGGSVEALADARRTVQWLYSDTGDPPPARHWPEDELHALRMVVAAFTLPAEPFIEMIAGMEMDVVATRYEDEATLALYCERVAGTVGTLMAHVLGTRDAAALQAARKLGIAMQMTNILRDVGEDLQRGRVYLPRPQIEATGDWAALAAARVAQTRRIYQEAELGIAYLDTFAKRWLVAMMSRIYGDILRLIERARYDVFSRRVRVGTARKLWLATAAFFAAARARMPA